MTPIRCFTHRWRILAVPTGLAAWLVVVAVLAGVTAIAQSPTRLSFTEEQAETVVERRKKALKWLVDSKSTETEERVFRLRGLTYLEAGDDARRGTIKALLESQREDGGWSQTDQLDSDAYATGTVLVALFRAGALKVSDPAYRRGVSFLMKTQHEDGSWYVKSRSKPFQTYFESGFPHGPDQFISISGSCWATMALIETVVSGQ